MDFVKRTGYPPSVTEIAVDLQATSPNAATCHLQALARLGYIEVDPKVWRGIRVTRDAFGAPVRLAYVREES